MALSQSRPASSTSVVLFMKKEPKKSVARIPEEQKTRFSEIPHEKAFIPHEESQRGWRFTCTGSHPHNGVKADRFLNVSSKVVQESLLIGLSLERRKNICIRENFPFFSTDLKDFFAQPSK